MLLRCAEVQSKSNRTARSSRKYTMDCRPFCAQLPISTIV